MSRDVPHLSRALPTGCDERSLDGAQPESRRWPDESQAASQRSELARLSSLSWSTGRPGAGDRSEAGWSEP